MNISTSEEMLLNFDGWLSKQDAARQEGLTQQLNTVPEALRSEEKQRLGAMVRIAEEHPELDADTINDQWHLIRGGYAERRGGDWEAVKNDETAFLGKMVADATQRRDERQLIQGPDNQTVPPIKWWEGALDAALPRYGVGVLPGVLKHQEAEKALRDGQENSLLNRAAEAAYSGKSYVDALGEWQQANQGKPGYLPERVGEYERQAREVHTQMGATLEKVRPVAQQAYAAMAQAREGQGGDIAPFALLRGLSRDEKQLAFRLMADTAAGAKDIPAGTVQVTRPEKSRVQALGEALWRGAERIAIGGQSASWLDQLVGAEFKAGDKVTEADAVKELWERHVAKQGAGGDAGAEVAALTELAGAARRSLTGRTLTADEASAWNRSLAGEIEDVKTMEALRQFGMGTIDPTTQAGGARFRKLVLPAADSAALMVGMMVPGSFEANQKSYQMEEFTRLSEAGMDDRQAMGAAKWSALAMATLDYAEGGLLLEGLPGAKRALKQFALTGSTGARFGANFAGTIAAETTVEVMQDHIIPAIVQDIATANPEFDTQWGEVWQETAKALPDLAMGMILLSAAGGVAQTRAQSNQALYTRRLSSSPSAMRLMGYTAQQIEEITAAPDLGQRSELLERYSPGEMQAPIGEERDKLVASAVKLAQEEQAAFEARQGAEITATTEAADYAIRVTNTGGQWNITTPEGKQVNVDSAEAARRIREDLKQAATEQEARDLVDEVHNWVGQSPNGVTRQVDLTGESVTSDGEKVFRNRFGVETEGELKPQDLDNLRRETQETLLQSGNGEMVSILGSNEEFRADVGELAGQMVQRLEINRSDSAMLTFLHEMVESNWRRGVRLGAVTLEQTQRAIGAMATAFDPANAKNAEQRALFERVQKIATGAASEVELRETLSELAVSDILGRNREGKQTVRAGSVSAALDSAISEGTDAATIKELGRFRAFLRTMRTYFRALIGTVSAIRRARKGGVAGEFDALMNQVLGLDEQAAHDKAVAEEAEAIANESGLEYVPPTAEEMEAGMAFSLRSKGRDSAGLPPAPKMLSDGSQRLIPTWKLETMPDGTSRAEWQKAQIKEELTKGVPVPEGQKPVAYFLGGGPGAGKSSLLEILQREGDLPRAGYVEVNPDNFTERNPNFIEVAKTGDSRGARVVESESSLMARQLYSQALKTRSPIIYDATLSDPVVAEIVAEQARAEGYETRFFGLTTEPIKALQDARGRAEKTFRYVTTDYGLEAHGAFNENVESYASLFDEWNLFSRDESGISEVAKKVGGNIEIDDSAAASYAQFSERRIAQTRKARGSYGEAGNFSEEAQSESNRQRGDSQARGEGLGARPEDGLSDQSSSGRGSGFRLSAGKRLELIQKRLDAALSKDPAKRREIQKRAADNLQRLQFEWESERWTPSGDKIRPIVERRTAKELDKEEAFRQASRADELTAAGMSSLTPAAAAAYSAGMESLEDRPLITAMLGNHGKLVSKSEAARRGDFGEYDGVPWLPPKWYSKTGGLMPDEMAQALYEDGHLREPSPDALWQALAGEIESVRNANEAFKEAASIVADVEREARSTARAEAGAWRAEQEAMQNKDWNPKARLIRDMRTLDAITSVLPPEVRGKVGGFIKLATLGSDKSRAEEIGRRIEKIGDLLEKHLQKEVTEAIEVLFEKAAPDRQPGKASRGKLGAEAHRFFDAAEVAMGMTEAELEAQRAALDAALAAPTLTNEQAAEIFERHQILDTFGDWEEKSAADMDAALTVAEGVYKTGRNARRIVEEARLAEVGALADQLVSTLVDGNVYAGVQAQKATKGAVLRFTSKLSLDLKSFAEVLDALLGDGHPLAKRWADMQRLAEAQRNDEKLAFRKRWKAALEAATGKQGVESRRAVWDMSHEQTLKAPNEGKREGSTEIVPITLIDQWADGTADPAALNVTQDEADALIADRSAMAADDRREGLPLKRSTRGVAAVVPLTEAEGIFLTMLGAQDQYVAGLDAAGWTADALAEIEKQLSAPALKLREFMRGEYRDGYGPLAAVFESMYGVALPKIKNYAPAAFYHTGSERETGPLENGGVGAGMRAGFLANRKKHTAAPRLENAFATFFGHSAQTAHWKAMAGFVREFSGVMGRPDVKAAIEAKHGAEMLRTLSDWTRNLEGNGLQKQAGQLDKAVSWLVSQQSYIALAFRLGTLMKQSSAVLGSAYRIPLGEYARGFGKLVTGQLDVAKIYASPVIQRRLESGFAPEVRAALDEIWTAKPTRRGALMQQGMELIGLTDALFTTGSAAIAFDYHLREAQKAGLSGAAAESAAMAEVEDIVARTAQPADTGTRSLFEARQGAFGRLLFMFASEARQKSSLLLTAWGNTLAGKATKADLRVLAVSHLIIAPMMQAITSAWRDMRDDDDDEIFDAEHWAPMDFLKAIVAGPLAGIPIIGSALSGFNDEGILGRSKRAGVSAMQLFEGPEEKDAEPVEWYVKRIARVMQGMDAFTGVVGSTIDQVFSVADDVLPDTASEAAKKERARARKDRKTTKND